MADARSRDTCACATAMSVILTTDAEKFLMEAAVQHTAHFDGMVWEKCDDV